jgi:hypothetical protein
VARTALGAKRGRPLKFGQPGRVVALTLPDDVVEGLKRIDSDLAWAIVRLFQARTRRPDGKSARQRDSELVSMAHGRAVIVVSRAAFPALPGITLIPLANGDRALIALAPDAGVADLEVAILDRMADRSIAARERTALAELRAQLRRWRRDPELHWQTRSILMVERARRRPSRRRPASTIGERTPHARR